MITIGKLFELSFSPKLGEKDKGPYHQVSMTRSFHYNYYGPHFLKLNQQVNSRKRRVRATIFLRCPQWSLNWMC